MFVARITLCIQIKKGEIHRVSSPPDFGTLERTQTHIFETFTLLEKHAIFFSGRFMSHFRKTVLICKYSLEERF